MPALQENKFTEKVISIMWLNPNTGIYDTFAEAFYREYDLHGLVEKLKKPSTVEFMGPNSAVRQLVRTEIFQKTTINYDFKNFTDASPIAESDRVYNILKEHKIYTEAPLKYPDTAQSWDEVSFYNIWLKDAPTTPALIKSREDKVLTIIKESVRCKPAALPYMLHISDDNTRILKNVIFTGNGDVKIGKDSSIVGGEFNTFIGGKLTMKENCQINDDCEIKEGVFLSQRCHVGKKTTIGSSCVMREVYIHGESEIGRSVLMENKFLPKYCDIPSYYAYNKEREMDISFNREDTIEKNKIPSNIPDFMRNIGSLFHFSDKYLFGFYNEFLDKSQISHKN